MTIDIQRTMEILATTRPLFHSERDFQFSLAWQIQTEHPDARIRLETRPAPHIHLDLLMQTPDESVAFELKYWVDRSSVAFEDEHFDLPNQGAQPLSRYDYIKDIVRCETFVSSGYVDRAIAIALTNHAGYWTKGRKVDGVDAAFKLHEGMELSGSLAWSAATGGTSRNREQPLVLAGSYSCHWCPYSLVARPSGRALEFRYLKTEVS